MKRRLRRNDDGAVGVIYAAMLLMLVGLVGFVLDIGGLRQDTRLDRAASDSAAVAGASALTRTTRPDPKAACLAAWRYAAVNVGATLPSPNNNCNTFKSPGDSGYSTCPSTATSQSGTMTLGSVTVTVVTTWPVDDNSYLMNPDLHPNPSLAITQPVTASDGSRCKRFGVEIARDRRFTFASVWGMHGRTIVNHSVALSTPGGGDVPIATPLVILDPTACQALQANGGAQVLVAANDTLTPGVPGFIAVNSDGSQCTGQNTTVDSNAQSGDGTHIWSNDSLNGGGDGRILLFASPPKDYKPAQTSTCVASGATWTAGQLCPVPEQLLSQISRFAFIDNKYNCVVAGTCVAATDPLNGIAQLRAYIGTLNAATIADPATRPAGWSYVGGAECTSPLPNYTGNVYVDCRGNGANSKFSVPNNQRVTFTNAATGGQSVVVFAGDAEVKAGGCLTFNSPASACTAPTLTPQAADGPEVFVAGKLNVNSNASSLIAPQTFVMQGLCNTDGTGCVDTTGASSSPFLNVSTNGTGSVMWSAPLGPLLASPTACVPGSAAAPPSAACFANLAYWNEYQTTSSTEDGITGGANLLLQGTFCTPNAQFNLHGGAFTDIRSAQFVTGRLNLTGGGQLTMVPDAAKTNPPPLLFAELIR